jgi:hypothetical protein
VNARHLAALIPMLCATTALTALGQNAGPSVQAGDRIRVQRFDVRHPRIGKLVARSEDSLTVEWLNGARESMSMFEIDQVEVSTGHHHYVARGTAYGLTIGAGVGYAIKKLIDHDRTDESAPKTATGTSALLVTLGGGAIFGALTGALGTEQWEPTPLGASRRRVGLVVPVSRRQVGVGISAEF